MPLIGFCVLTGSLHAQRSGAPRSESVGVTTTRGGMSRRLPTISPFEQNFAAVAARKRGGILCGADDELRRGCLAVGNLVSSAMRRLISQFATSSWWHVQPHFRSSPNNSRSDNWSSKGSYNPHTSKVGSKDPYRSTYRRYVFIFGTSFVLK